MTKIQGLVNGSSAPKEFNGVLQIGFTLKDNPKQWYNVPGEEEALTELREAVLQKGAEISFEYVDKKVGDITLISLPKAQSQEGNWADDMTSFEDLLADAHKNFGEKMHIRTELLRDGAGNPLVDFVKKTAIFKAQVYIRRDDKNTQVFEGHGDAQGISNKTIEPHFMRMAETRAICRALRWATNNARAAVEETGEEPKEEKKEAKKNAKPSN